MYLGESKYIVKEKEMTRQIIKDLKIPCDEYDH